MRFCLSWLKEHLGQDISLNQVIDSLIKIGLEVEEVIDQGAIYRNFKLGKITGFEKHPQADRLNCCLVDIGEFELISVVCGGSNVRKDMFVSFAPVGAFIPSTGIVLKEGIIRGIPSKGMLCSTDELNLGPSQNHEIMDIQTDMPVGTSLDKVLGLDDVILDISITPNRGDCFSLHGIARDLKCLL